MEQIGDPEPRTPSRYCDEWILRNRARPRCRYRGEMPTRVAVEDPVLGPVLAPDDDVELLAEAGMERMDDPNGSGQIPRAARS